MDSRSENALEPAAPGQALGSLAVSDCDTVSAPVSASASTSTSASVSAPVFASDGDAISVSDGDNASASAYTGQRSRPTQPDQLQELPQLAEDVATHKLLLTSDDKSKLQQAAPSSPDPPSPEYPFELQQLANFLRNRPRSNDHIIEFFLPVEQYQQLSELSIDGRFAGSRLRYDYSSATETLALRMIGGKHESLTQYLNNRLRSFLDRPAIIEHTSSLRYHGSADLEYPSRCGNGYIVHEPDISITNLNKPTYPVVVVEVAHAQSTKELHNLAREYIEQTEGHIQTVITLDFDYPRGKGAYLTVWKARFGEDGRFKEVARGDIVEIRNRDGVKNPDPRAGVSLSLRDFGVTRLRTRADYQVLTILGDDVYARLEEWEQENELVKVARADFLARVQARSDLKRRRNGEVARPEGMKRRRR
ncbi:hypothetical protein AYL99_12126 [Fonsecaea erecta]|uniref:Restriction endonuclease domain-containing protein n=1 Tax=Fonsecaea erecta TaxID=1367422 RepID=A0A178Z1M2_9EURO|nr:hypothetical protein AYL99_12126 [Fonsecaea erecta]OAP53700.1 hypothetical protein AYL99_12126 [Fonsecaea erecta]